MTSGRRLTCLAVVLGALCAPAVAGAEVEIRSVDAAAYPRAQATIVTSKPSKLPPQLIENGIPASGVLAQNLGAARSICLAVDHSRSMRGAPLEQATAAASAFVAAKLPTDRVCVTSFATEPLLLHALHRRGLGGRRRARRHQGRPDQGHDALRRHRARVGDARRRGQPRANHHHHHRRERDAVFRDAGRRDQGRAGGRDDRLRRCDREQGVHARPAPVPREADGRQVLRHAVARCPQGHLRRARRRAEANLAARLHHVGAPGRVPEARRAGAGARARLRGLSDPRDGGGGEARRPPADGRVRQGRLDGPRAARRPARARLPHPPLHVRRRRPRPRPGAEAHRAEAEADEEDEGEEGAPPVARRAVPHHGERTRRDASLAPPPGPHRARRPAAEDGGARLHDGRLQPSSSGC